MKYLTIILCVIIGLFFYMNHNRDIQQLKINHVSRILNTFRLSLEYYCNITKEPVISTNLSITIDEIVSMLLSEREPNYDGIALLKEIKGGKDSYGNEYLLRIDVDSGEVILTAVHTPSNTNKNMQSVANIDFSMVKVVGANGNQIQIGRR